MSRRFLLVCLASLLALPGADLAAQRPGDTDRFAPGKRSPAAEIANFVAEQPPAAKPPFEATLLVLEADWSKSPTAKEVEDDLRRGLIKTAIPEQLRADLLVHGPEILFAQSSIVHYRPEHCAGLLAWMTKHKLIKSQFAFSQPRAVQLRLRGGASVRNGDGFEADVTAPRSAVPVLNPYENQNGVSLPFVETTILWKWRLLLDPVRPAMELTRTLIPARTSQGRSIPSGPPLRQASIWLENQPGECLFVQAFSADSNAYDFVHQQAVYPVILIRPAGQKSSEDVSLGFRTPEKVVPSERAFHESQFVVEPVSLAAVFPLRKHDPLSAVATIKALFAGSRDSETPAIEADLERLELLVRGTPEQLSQIRRLLRQMGEGDDQPEEPMMKRNQPGVERPRATEAIATLREEYDRRDAQSLALAKQLRQAKAALPPNHPDAVKQLSELRVAVEAAFLAGQKLHEAELNEFRDRMLRLQGTIEERRRNPDRVIDRRVDDLLNPAWKWETQLADVAPPRAAADTRLKTAADAAARETELEGVWEIKLAADDEKKVSAEKRLRLVFHGNRAATFEGDRRRDRWRFVVDRNRTPHRLVMVGLDDMQVIRGPFEIKEEGLRMNMSSDPQVEPTTFGTERPEFIRISKTVNQSLRDATDSSVSPVDTKGGPPPSVATISARPRKPIIHSETVGVVSVNAGDEFVVISCAAPGGIRFGDELLLVRPSTDVPGQGMRQGRVVIVEIQQPAFQHSGIRSLEFT